MTNRLSHTSNQKFTDARRRVFMKSAMNFLKGQPGDLLPFEEIRSTLKLNHTRHVGVQEVELDKIVGSVGRYRDFTREFLPLRDNQGARWREIYDLTNSSSGFPPVELYKIGLAYFVRDGNHRVSVARANNAATIEAYVTEYRSPVEIDSNDTLDDILIKAGAANFLAVTHLDKLRPEQDVKLTNPGRYKQLLGNIALHKYFIEVECQCEISYQEAVSSWYDNVYRPLIEEIRERDILKKFPGRTEADIYAWLVLHRADLEEVYGFGQVDNQTVVDALEEEADASPIKKLERAIKRKLDPDSLPPPVA